MPQPVNIQSTLRSTDRSESWHGEIPDMEWGLLLEFHDEAGLLAETSMFRNGSRASVEISYGPNGLGAQSILPPRDDVDALLHRLRPFVLHRERLNYDGVHKVLWRCIDFAPFRRMLAGSHRLFHGRDFGDQVRITVGDGGTDHFVNCEVTLERWLNATQYHRDQEKAKQLERIGSVFPIAQISAVFVMMLQDKARAILELASLIRALRDRDGQVRRIAI